MILKSMGRRHLRSYAFYQMCYLRLGIEDMALRDQIVLETSWNISSIVIIREVELASFFLARSPEAPRMTRMVFSRILRGADMLSGLWLVDIQTIFALNCSL